MRPRYEARNVSVWDIKPHPWCVVEHTAHGPRVAVYCDTIEDANSHAARLNATAEGLRRLGVAVAVWGAMAAAAKERNAWLEIVAHYECARAQRLHALATALRDELAAERAARRKWELRLRERWRNKALLLDIDRIALRAMVYPQRFEPPSLPFGWPIAGPRGVLP